MEPDTESDGEGGTEVSFTKIKTWTLLDGSRMIVAGVTASIFLVLILTLSVSEISPLRSYQPLFYVFGGLISGNLTLITVIVSINQLLLSQELRTPNELRQEIEGMIDYRRDIEDSAGQIAPVEPLGFLRLVMETNRQQAQQLGGISISEAEQHIAEEIDQVVVKITEQADRVDDLLEEHNVGTFQVLSTTLNTNYAREINRLRQIKFSHRDGLPSDVSESIDDLIDLLQNIDIARQYLKTIYLQQELASLSRLLFYTGLPSIAIVAMTLFVFTTSSGTAVPYPIMTILLPVVITIGLFPLTVLFSFILRTATVARRTAAIIPFTAPTQEN